MTDSSLQPSMPDAGSSGFAAELMRWFGDRTKASLATSAAICFCIFWCLGSVTGLPAEPGFDGSLLAQQSPLVALLVTAFGLVACSLLMNLIQARGELEDPLFGVAIGLAAFSCRAGTMTSLLQFSWLPVFFWLIVELLMLYATLCGCWWLLRTIRRRGAPPAGAARDDWDWNSRLLTVMVTAIVMGICMCILAQTDAKKQVLASVGMSAFIGAAVAYSFFELPDALCYAAAPLIVGVFGYLLAYFLPGNWLTGRIGQPLAYPLPLDYASLGAAGALLGYWTAQKWKEESQG